ncbi:MAG: hypothetical protein ACFE7R_10945 [Candidatus Hodarchaeota archaeon]
MTTEPENVPNYGCLIFKVLVLGADRGLQAGYLNSVSAGSVSYLLYSSLGLGIGVARTRLDEGLEIVLQLWSLASSTRHAGLAETFRKGHCAAVIVLRPEEMENFEVLYSQLDERAKKFLVTVLVTENETIGPAIETISQVLEDKLRIEYGESVIESIPLLGEGLKTVQNDSEFTPTVLVVDSACCPVHFPVINSRSMPPNTVGEIAAIKEFGISIGVTPSVSECTLSTEDGQISVELNSGDVYLEPVTCSICARTCKRKTRICIVGIDQGWSSDNLGPRALLTMSKLHSLAENDLPEHVEKQIHNATRCNKLVLPPDYEENEEIRRILLALGYRQRGRRWSLEEEADRRLQEGRLSEENYEAIIGRLHRVNNHE